jgi:hypothetical protein
MPLPLHVHPHLQTSPSLHRGMHGHCHLSSAPASSLQHHVQLLSQFEAETAAPQHRLWGDAIQTVSCTKSPPAARSALVCPKQHGDNLPPSLPVASCRRPTIAAALTTLSSPHLFSACPMWRTSCFTSLVPQQFPTSYSFAAPPAQQVCAIMC